MGTPGAPSAAPTRHGPQETFPRFGVHVEVTAPASWDANQVRRVFTRLLRVDGWPLELVAVSASAAGAKSGSSDGEGRRAEPGCSGRDAVHGTG